MSLNCDSVVAPPTMTSRGLHFSTVTLKLFCRTSASLHSLTFQWLHETEVTSCEDIFFVHWTVLYWSGLGRIWIAHFVSFSLLFFSSSLHWPSNYSAIPLFFKIPYSGLYIFLGFSILKYFFFFIAFRVFLLLYLHIVSFFLTKVAARFVF